jgi:type IV secretion system protein VirD4
VKRKIILWSALAGIASILAGAFSLLLSSILHFQLKHRTFKPAFFTLSGMLRSVTSDKQHFLLFISFLAAVLLIAALLIISGRRRHYESDMRRITPKIRTPVAAGQCQHGSARWLPKSEFHQAFATEIIDFENPLIKELISHGYDPVAKGKEIKPRKPSVGKRKKAKPKIRPAVTRPISIVSEGWSGNWINE